LEGFDVVRTNGLGETLRKYGYLTKSIYQYYKSLVNDDQRKVADSCPSYDDFVQRCPDLGKMTISDVFAIQLMQVLSLAKPSFGFLSATFFAIAVLDKYKTLRSLASAYSKLVSLLHLYCFKTLMTSSLELQQSIYGFEG